jgi:methylisocitrate lyase
MEQPTGRLPQNELASQRFCHREPALGRAWRPSWLFRWVAAPSLAMTIRRLSRQSSSDALAHFDILDTALFPPKLFAVSSDSSPGFRFRAALAAERPLQIVGAINAYAALLAQQAGFRALYLSGAGVANHSYGVPDIGLTELADVLIDVRRITRRVNVPLLVDIDTGWDDPATAVREIALAGAAAVHLEDQVPAKRCGHLPGKQIVPIAEMVDRVKSAVRGKPSPDFVLIARTDAAANEGATAALARAKAYVSAGADMIFAEALRTLEDYRTFTAALNVPVLANLTEFGQTPYFTVEELGAVGVAMVLYPLSASRAAAASSRDVYQAIRRDGTQREVVAQMQTRADLYEILEYKVYEQKLPAAAKGCAGR